MTAAGGWTLGAAGTVNVGRTVGVGTTTRGAGAGATGLGAGVGAADGLVSTGG